MPLGGTSAACSTIVGAIVGPPYSWNDSPGPPFYCPSSGPGGGCGELNLTVHAPEAGPPEPLVGTILFGAYYHT
jgi:hypothetical protein